MDGLLHIPAQKVLLFSLVLSRVSGLVVTAPAFGTAEVPAQARALLALGLAALVIPGQWHVHPAPADSLAMWLVLVGAELLVGMALGLGVALVLAGADAAGQLVGQASGLMAAELFDPTQNENVSLFSRVLFLTAVAIFVLIGGHRLVMAALLDTFRTMPPGSAVWRNSLAETFVTLALQSLTLGVRAAAPALAALLLANLVLGLIGRTLPQLNIFLVGFGLNAMLALGILALSLGTAIWVFQDQVGPAIESVLAALGETNSPTG